MLIKSSDAFSNSNSSQIRQFSSDGNMRMTSETFICLCKNFLLDDLVTQDNQIAASEVTTFFEYLWNKLRKPSCENTNIAFHSRIQLEFINVICRDNETSQIDIFCIIRLREGVGSQNQYAYEITSQSQMEDDIEQYCSVMYLITDEYQFGDCEPSSFPSFTSPIRPKASRYLHSSLTKSIETRSRGPINSGNISSLRTPSMIDERLNPMNQAYNYKTSFMYMMGFDNANIKMNILANIRGDLMESTSDTIIKILQEHALSVSIDGVKHSTKVGSTCTKAFISSTHCIMVMSEVSSSSLSEVRKESVNRKIFTVIRDQMSDDTFRNMVNHEEVRELKYISDGEQVYSIPPLSLSRLGSSESEVGVGGGYTELATIASVFFLSSFLLF